VFECTTTCQRGVHSPRRSAEALSVTTIRLLRLSREDTPTPKARPAQTVLIADDPRVQPNPFEPRIRPVAAGSYGHTQRTNSWAAPASSRLMFVSIGSATRRGGRPSGNRGRSPAAALSSGARFAGVRRCSRASAVVCRSRSRGEGSHRRPSLPRHGAAASRPGETSGGLLVRRRSRAQLCRALVGAHRLFRSVEILQQLA
jgi:hypothetical protein